MTSLPFNISKYFKKIGITGYRLQPETKPVYKYIIVVPAISESENIPILLESLNNQESKYFDTTLIVIAVNNIISSSPEIVENNRLLIQYLNRVIAENKFSNLNLAYVDVSTDGNEMPDKDGGVGLARKIGMDTALNYFDYDGKGKNILGCLDADCKVENNYFDAVIEYYNHTNAEAGYVNYFHPLPDDLENKKAIICYEIFLRFYVFGLEFAKSPYAFHTIGSTMNSTAEMYVKIGGMNKRKAAEDFYFMEKLSKVTDIHKIDKTSIYPSGRGSFRVPFGTGQRVNRYLAGTHEEYFIYNIESFAILKKWVELFHDASYPDADFYLSEAEKISSKLREFLELQSFGKNWNKFVENSGQKEQINLQKRLWFDGFKTLKLIHFLRDNGFENKPMFPHLAEVFEMNGGCLPGGYAGETIPEINIQIEFLKILRELT